VGEARGFCILVGPEAADRGSESKRSGGGQGDTA
jgi:hypothetical protein